MEIELFEGTEREGTCGGGISDGAGISAGDGDHLISGCSGTAKDVVAGGTLKVFDVAEAVCSLAGAAAGLGGIGIDRDIDIAAAGIAERVGASSTINRVAAGVGTGDGLVVSACRDVDLGR